MRVGVDAWPLVTTCSKSCPLTASEGAGALSSRQRVGWYLHPPPLARLRPTSSTLAHSRTTPSPPNCVHALSVVHSASSLTLVQLHSPRASSRPGGSDELEAEAPNSQDYTKFGLGEYEKDGRGAMALTWVVNRPEVSGRGAPAAVYLLAGWALL